MNRARVVTFVAFGLAAAAGLAAYAVLSFEQPPGFSELPQSWFVRPATAPPASWRLPGAAEVRIETTGAVNLQIVPEARADVAAGLIGVAKLDRSPDGGFIVSGAAKAPCPAAAGAGAPTLVLHTPASVAIRAKGPFAATVGPARNLLIDSDGCATWKIASAQTLWLAERGGAQAAAGPVEDLRLARWGKGADRIEAVTHAADVTVHGAGSVELAKARGILDAAVWGSGRILIGDGFVGQERIWVKGSGQVLHHGSAGQVTGETRLSGRIRVREARGVASGAGDIQVGRANAPLRDF